MSGQSPAGQGYNPESFRARQMALHWLQVNRPERALEVLSGASVNHDDVFVWFMRAYAHHALQQFDLCRRAIREGLARDPEHVPLLELASRLHAEHGDLAQAESMLLAALRIEPQSAALLAGYARLVARAGQIDKAQALIERAAQFDPEEPDVRAVRGFLGYVQGDDEALAREGRALLEQNPSDTLGHRLLAAQHIHAGRPDLAAPHAREVVHHDLRDQDAIETAREARFWSHPLMIPMRPLAAFGMAKTWVAAVIVLAVLRPLSPTAALIGTIVWVSLCVYSWTVPYFLRKWLERRGP